MKFAAQFLFKQAQLHYFKGQRVSAMELIDCAVALHDHPEYAEYRTRILHGLTDAAEV